MRLRTRWVKAEIDETLFRRILVRLRQKSAAKAIRVEEQAQKY